MTYRRVRTDYPKGVVAVYDNGGQTIDRYTVVYTPEQHSPGLDYFSWVYMSGEPTHPQGVCQHGEGTTRPLSGWGTPDHNQVIAFEELPEQCQQIVQQDLTLA